MLITLFVSILLIAGCRKETKIANPEADVQSFTAREDNDGCRLVGDTSEFADLAYTYNQRGLVDEYSLSYYDGFFKMEYNERGQLVKSRFYSGGALVNTIVFFYQDDRVVKETWYDGATQTKTDEVFYTFNRNGKVSKSQSFIQDYMSFYKYTPDGDDVSEWDFFVGGFLSYTQQYTFLAPHHKAPDSATPGLQYDFTGPNGRLTEDSWYSTSEKDVSYDAEGNNPEVILDQDPGKTIVQFNKHNYITFADFFDKLTQSYVHFKFDYAGCGGGSYNSGNAAWALKPHPVNTNKATVMRFARLGSSKSIKEQLKEFRKSFLSKQP